MALKFQLRSTSLDAWYAKAFSGHASLLGSPAVISSAAPGVFGGKLIDMSGNSANAALGYMAGENWATGVAGFTLLMRIVPNWSGVPGTTQNLFIIGDSSGSICQGVQMDVNSSGVIDVRARNADATACYADRLYAPSTPAFPTFISGQAIDLWLRWNGLGGQPFELWAAAPGQVPTQLTNSGANNAYENGDVRGLFCALSMRLGINFVFDGFQTNYGINEFALWDSFEDPTSYGARTGFISAPNLQGYSYSDPGATNVAAGISYQFAGVTEVGTLGSITNEYVAPTLVVTGQSLNATLEET
jgi:hypothetical protein